MACASVKGDWLNLGGQTNFFLFLWHAILLSLLLLSAGVFVKGSMFAESINSCGLSAGVFVKGSMFAESINSSGLSAVKWEIFAT